MKNKTSSEDLEKEVLKSLLEMEEEEKKKGLIRRVKIRSGNKEIILRIYKGKKFGK